MVKTVGIITIKRYNKATIVYHWVHGVIFIVLILTGIPMFLPGMNSHSGSAHIGAAILFVALSILYSLYYPKNTLCFLKRTLRWGKEDIEWLRAAPDYYFGGAGTDMPEQGYINTGQKAWQGVIVIFGMMLVVTGAVMWLFKSHLPIHVYQYILIAHDVGFITIFVMFLIHIYMGLLHPRNRGAFRSMLDGQISAVYAKHHYRKWYDRMTDPKVPEEL